VNLEANLLGGQVEDFRVVGERVRSWGRWGDADERGTANLITDDHVAGAARLIRSGRVFELGIAIDAATPQPGGLRTRPMRLMAETGEDQDFPGGFHYADDYVFLALQAATQWDALAHVYYDDRLYNGFSADSLTPHGARHCAIDRLGPGPVGRGVLLDLPRTQGVDWLTTQQVVTPDDLDQAGRRQGVAVNPGDILLVRTGWRRRYLAEGAVREVMTREPGLGMACAEWLRDHDVAALGCDNWGVEVVPPESRDLMLPLHLVLIRDLGLTIGEMFDLEALAEDCVADGRFEFFFCGQALKFTGGVGSPLNPLAIK
jgi:kynurenine formamidase